MRTEEQIRGEFEIAVVEATTGGSYSVGVAQALGWVLKEYDDPPVTDIKDQPAKHRREKRQNKKEKSR